MRRLSRFKCSVPCPEAASNPLFASSYPLQLYLKPLLPITDLDLARRWRRGGFTSSRAADALGLPAEPFDKHKSYDWPDTGASLILISLLSLGLWAAIWGTVASLAAASG
jgi:hypothetical protein